MGARHRELKYGEMNYRWLYMMCLLTTLFACGKEEQPAAVSSGDVLSIYVATRSGEPPLPEGNYGLYSVEHASGVPFSWVGVSSFYNNNLQAALNSGRLKFSGTHYYPINDWLSVFLYWPHQAGATPDNIPISRSVTEDSNGQPADKYPDYLGGSSNISLIGGTPEGHVEPSVALNHLMSRVRFQTKNPGSDDITLLSVKLTGITWSGVINPQITDVNDGYYAPSGGVEDITLIENFVVPGHSGSGSAQPRPIMIYPEYNYSDDEAALEAIDYKYYLLVPPLGESQLAHVQLEMKFIRYGDIYIIPVDMKSIKINKWEPGNSYCYTISFNTYMIDQVDVDILPWKEELYTGKVPL